MAGSGKAGASSPSPPSPPSVAGAARGPQSGDVTSGGDGRCPHGGGVASGSGRHGSATVSGGSPRCDVGRPTDSDGRATRDNDGKKTGVFFSLEISYIVTLSEQGIRQGLEPARHC
ncbi:hypothetical protein ACOMHN_029553 [Nucella lapillus]